MTKHLDGQRFGWLIVINRQAKSEWNCLCDCGNKCIVTTESLSAGERKSCGCWKASLPMQHRLRHLNKALNNGRFMGVKSEQGCFTAHYTNGGKRRIYIGRYPTPIDAAKAYDQKMIELFGANAVLNFPPEQEEGEETFIGEVIVSEWQ